MGIVRLPRSHAPCKFVKFFFCWVVLIENLFDYICLHEISDSFISTYPCYYQSIVSYTKFRLVTIRRVLSLTTTEPGMPLFCTSLAIRTDIFPKISYLATFFQIMFPTTRPVLKPISTSKLLSPSLTQSILEAFFILLKESYTTKKIYVFFRYTSICLFNQLGSLGLDSLNDLSHPDLYELLF